jgi:RNA polymerase sigma-70 factor (ECF subfamily)
VDDLALLARWRGGDQGAGQQLFARHLADVYRFFHHKVGTDADELVQGTFLACLSSVERFRGESSFRTYLFAIARHELFAFLRRRSQREHVDFELTSIEDIATSPGSRLDRVRRGDRLRDALAQLPLEQQVLLELHYWHDLDAAALAEVLDASPGTIRVRLLRARRALRELLGADGMAEIRPDPMTSAVAEGPEEPLG